jgi:hypothetical protein
VRKRLGCGGWFFLVLTLVIVFALTGTIGGGIAHAFTDSHLAFGVAAWGFGLAGVVAYLLVGRWYFYTRVTTEASPEEAAPVEGQRGWERSEPQP